MEYFPCYHSYKKKLKNLSDQEVGRLFRALMDYSESGERQELAGREAIAYDFIADDIDRAKEAYSERCEKNRENISKRYDRIQSNTTVYESYQSKSKSKSKSNVIPSGEGITAPAREEKQPLVPVQGVALNPPTLEEVSAYAEQAGRLECAKPFFDYYSAGKWRDAQNAPIYNWHQKFMAWCLRQDEKDARSGSRKQAASDAGKNSIAYMKEYLRPRAGRERDI